MQRKLKWLFVIGIIGVAAYGGTVLATPPSGVVSTVFAVGQFDAIDAKTLSSGWQARIETKATSRPSST